jgi:K+-dependent Na+/Ca+ exchanger-like protein
MLRVRLTPRQKKQKRQLTNRVVFGATCVTMALIVGVSHMTRRAEDTSLSLGGGVEIEGHRHLSATGPFATVCTPGIRDRGAGYAVGMFFATIYIFAGLGVICDDFFVPALEMISEKLHLSDDVAGATFLAAGSSAPELFTSVADTFAATEGKGGEGFGMGTIVGSAMFNILVIVALSAAVVPEAVKVDPRPIMRDCGFYATSIALLMAFMNDGVIEAWEAIIMVVVYALYIVYMVFNQSIANSFLCAKCSPPRERQVSGEIEMAKKGEAGGAPADVETDNKDTNGEKKDDDEEDDNDPDKYFQRFEMPGSDTSLFDKVYWVLTLPLSAAMTLTTPDCSKTLCKNLYVATFIISIGWIGFLCLLMVKTAADIGCVAGIDPAIMGICVLAIGTSVPDAMGSVIVAREGKADMAIANAIGSNVFDILLGLGVPWTIKTLAVGSNIMVDNCGIFVAVAILFGTLGAFFSVLFLNKWNFDPRAGTIFVIIYAVYFLYSLLVGVNVIPKINQDCDAQ